MAQALITIYAGATNDPLSVTAQLTSGAATDLTGATLSVVFSGPNRFTGTGTFAVTSATGGLFTYTFSATDVAVAGDYELQFIATYAGKPRYYVPIGLRILATL